MFQKTKDVVMTIGRNLKEKAIEGEYLGKGGVAVGTAAVATFSGSALAAVPTEVTTAISTAAADVAIVGAAVIVVMVGIKIWKWIQRAL